MWKYRDISVSPMAKGKGEGIGRRNNGRSTKMSKNDERSVSGLPKVNFILMAVKTLQ